MENNQQELESLFQQGSQHFHAGQFADAYQNYLRCNELRPVTGEILNALGLAAFMLKRFDLAVHWFEALLRLSPANSDGRLNLGSSLFELGQMEAALANYDAVINDDERNAQAWYNRGVVLRQLKRLDESEASYLRAISIKPDYAEAHSNLGVVYHEQGLHQRALSSYAQAQAIKPDYAEAYSNAGATYMALADYDASLQSYEAALRHNPRLPSACWNKGILLLLKGDFERGLPLYEWRFHHQRQALFRRPLNLATPRLTAQENIEGKTVLVYDEQGLGDTIQMVRYVPFLAKKGARVILRAAAELHALFENIEGLHQLQGDFEDPAQHDYQCPMMSLPLACGTLEQTIPAEIPYLRADFSRIEAFKRLLADSRPNQVPSRPVVGLVWAGNPRNPTDARRSIPLSKLVDRLPYGPLYVSMQKGASADDIALLATRTDMIDLSSHLNDFTDTAALCMCVDRMLCVDTSVAHLAGALGVPVDLLIACVPDWRWMLNREDSPWYPGMRLWRQPQPGDWDGVLERLAARMTSVLHPSDDLHQALQAS